MIPKPPPGFVLDEPVNGGSAPPAPRTNSSATGRSALPPPPRGFVLDEQESPPEEEKGIVGKAWDVARGAVRQSIDDLTSWGRSLTGTERPSVMEGRDGGAPTRSLIESRGAPVSPEIYEAVRRRMDAATPEERKLMVSQPGWLGRVASAVNESYQREDEQARLYPSTADTLDKLGTRRELRERQLLSEYKDPGFAARRAEFDARIGAPPGRRVAEMRALSEEEWEDTKTTEEWRVWTGQMAMPVRAGLGALNQLQQAGAGAYMAAGDSLSALGAKAIGDALSQFGRDASRTFAARREGIEYGGETMSGVGAGIESAITNLPGLAVGIATRNPQAALTFLAGVVGLQKYGEGRTKHDMSPMQAAAYGIGHGGIEYATEKMPTEFIVRAVGTKNLWRLVAGALFRELPGEQLATAGQDFLDALVEGRGKPFDEVLNKYLSERGAAAYQTLIATLVGTALLSGAGHVMHRMARLDDEKGPEEDLMAIARRLQAEADAKGGEVPWTLEPAPQRAPRPDFDEIPNPEDVGPQRPPPDASTIDYNPVDAEMARIEGLWRGQEAAQQAAFARELDNDAIPFDEGSQVAPEALDERQRQEDAQARAPERTAIADLEAAYQQLEAERQARKDAELSAMQRQQAEEQGLAHWRAAEAEGTPQGAMEAALERANVRPEQFPSKPVNPEQRAIVAAENRVINESIEELPDRLLRYVAKKGQEPFIRDLAQAEINRRETAREKGPQPEDQETLRKAVHNQPLTREETRRAIQLGIIQPEEAPSKLGRHKLTMRGYEYRRQLELENNRPYKDVAASRRERAEGERANEQENQDRETIRRLNAATGQSLALASRAEVRDLGDADAGERLARAFGRRIVWVKGDGHEGFIDPGRPDTLFIHVESERPHLSVIAHELLHSLSVTSPAVYNRLQRRLRDLLQNTDIYRDWLASKNEHLSREQLDALTYEELTGDLLGDHMLDKQFWREVFRGQKRSFVEQVADAINRVLDAIKIRLGVGQLRGFGSRQYVKDVEAVRKALADAFNEWAEAEGATIKGLNEPAQAKGTTTDVKRELPRSSRRGKRPSPGLERVIKRLHDILPKDERGRYIGSGGMSYEGLRKTLIEYGRLARSGKKIGADTWYKDSVEAIVRAFNGNKGAAEIFFQVIAITSAHTEVKSNFTAAEKALHQYALGMPINVGTKTTNDKLNDLLYFGIPWEGRKTNNFYKAMMAELHGTPVTESVVDIWHGRAVLGKDSLTREEYDFADAITVAIAEHLGDQVQRVQAAIWVPIKAMGLLKRWVETGQKVRRAEAERRSAEKGGGGGVLELTSDEQEGFKVKKSKFASATMRELRNAALAEASIDYGDLVNRRWGMLGPETSALPTSAEVAGRIINVTAEVKPSTKLDIGKVVAQWSMTRLRQFQNDAVAATFGDGGVRTFLNAFGMNETMVRVIDGVGTYDGGIAPNLLLMLNGSRDQAEFLAKSWMYIFRQDAVPYFRAIPQSDESQDAQGVVVNFSKNLSDTDVRAFYNAMRGNVHAGLDLTMLAKNKAVIINFTNMPNTTFIGAMEAFLKSGAVKNLDGYGKINAESAYPTHDWVADPAGKDLINGLVATGRPNLQARLDNWADLFWRFAQSQGGQLPAIRPSERSRPGRLDDREADAEGRRRNQGQLPEQAQEVAPRGYVIPAVGPDTPVVSLRPRQPDAVTVVGIHYSNTGGIARLIGAMHGRGIRGAERSRLAKADPRLRRRAYFYAQVGARLPVPEDGLGNEVYRVKLTNLYDPRTEKITADTENEWELKIIEAGYDGYLSPKNRVAVILNGDVPVEGIGTRQVASNVLLDDYTATVDLAAQQAEKPTPAQAQAGNYRKGHATISGIPITIENPAGSEREWTAPDGTRGKTVMRAHYGYIKRTEGADGDPVDVFIRPGTPPDWSGPVFVMNQRKPGNGHFDEHKALIGWNTAVEAKRAYDQNYQRGWSGADSLVQFTLDDFKDWLENGDTTLRVGEQPVEYTVTYEVPTPLRAAQDQPGERPATVSGAQAGQVEVFAANPKADKKKIGERFATEVRQVTVGSFYSGVEKVEGPQDAAHVFAPLRKESVEHALYLVLNKDRRPLAMVRAGVGTRNQTSVYPAIMAQIAHSIPGARWIWFAHNHPSGKPEPSFADMALTKEINETLKDTGVDLAGHIVIGAGGSAYWFDGDQPTGRTEPKAAARRLTIPEAKFRYTKIGKLSNVPLTGPADVRTFLKRDLDPGEDGVLLTDWQHYAVAWVPMSIGEMRRLRTGVQGTGASRMFQAINKSGAAAMFLHFHDPRRISTVRAAGDNMHEFGERADARLLDAFFREKKGDDLKSLAETGIGFSGLGTFLSRRDRPSQADAVLHSRRSRPGDITWDDIDLILYKNGNRYESEDGNYAIEPDGKGKYWTIAFGSEFGWGDLGRAKALVKSRYIADVDAGLVKRPMSNDPLSGVDIDQKARVIRGWEKLAESPTAFLTKRSYSKDPQQIAKDMGLEGQVRVTPMTENPFMNWFEIILPDRSRAILNYMSDWSDRWSESRPRESDRPGPGAYLDASGLKGHGYGRIAYQIALTWAHNNGVKLYPDPSGLTPINTVRRTEQMIAAALKFGDTKFLEPDPDQRIDGWISDPVTQAHHDDNLARLILRSWQNIEKAMEGIAKFGEIRYNFESRRFEDASGNKVTAKDFDELSRRYRNRAKDTPSSDAGIGRTSLARAAFTRSLLEGGVGVDEFLDSAVPAGGILTTEVQGSLALYSRRGRPGSGQTQGPGGQKQPAAQGAPVAGAQGSTPLRRVRMPKWAESMPPETKAALVKAGVITTEKTWRERVHELTENWRTRFAQKLFDHFAPIKLIDDTAYMMARLSRSADTALEALLLYGRPHLDNGAVNVVISEKQAAKLKPNQRAMFRVAKGERGLVEILQDLQNEQDRFFAWIAGNRAYELKNEGRENLFTTDDITALRFLNQGNMPDGTSRAQLYDRVHKEFNAVGKAVLDIAEQAGLIDPESRAYWEKDFYVPFYRVIEEEASGPTVKTGLVNQYAFKRLKGGSENLHDLLENTLRNWSHLLDASLKNQAALRTLTTAANLGAAVEASETVVRQMGRAMDIRQGVVSVMDGGKQRWFLIEDPMLLEAVGIINDAGMPGWTKPIAAFKRWLTFGVTVDPAFKIRNLIRDSVSALAVTPVSANIARNLATGWQATAHDSPWRASMLAGGAIFRFGTMIEGSRADYTRQLIQMGVDANTILDKEHKVVSMLKYAFERYQELGDRGENINRAALYLQQREAGKTHLEASFQARDLLDFSMQGSGRIVRFLVMASPFLNARLQGLYKLGRGAVEQPGRFSAVLGATAVASVLLMLMFKDDEEWKKREDWDRDNFWWFRIGDIAYRIPKPFEVGAIGTLAERMAEWVVNDEMNGKDLARRMFAIVYDNLAMNPIPQIARPLIELWADRNMFTGRQITPEGMKDLPVADRIGRNTSATAQLVGKAGVMSPVQIDHAIRGYFGWLGTMTVSAADLIIGPVIGVAPRPTRDLHEVFFSPDIPGGHEIARAASALAEGSGMVQKLPSRHSRYVTMFYEQAEEIETAYKGMKSQARLGNFDEARRRLGEHGVEIGLHKMVQRERIKQGLINLEMRRIEASKDLSPEEKRAKLNELFKLRNERLRDRALAIRRERGQIKPASGEQGVTRADQR